MGRHPGSGVITSSEIADSPMMETFDDNPGLLIIHDASYKHYLTIYVSFFSDAFKKNMKKYSCGFVFICDITIMMSTSNSYSK